VPRRPYGSKVKSKFEEKGAAGFRGRKGGNSRNLKKRRGVWGSKKGPLPGEERKGEGFVLRRDLFNAVPECPEEEGKAKRCSFEPYRKKGERIAESH